MQMNVHESARNVSVRHVVHGGHESCYVLQSNGVKRNAMRFCATS